MMYNKKFYEWFEERFNEADVIRFPSEGDKKALEVERKSFRDKISFVSQRIAEVKAALLEMSGDMDVSQYATMIDAIQDKWDNESRHALIAKFPIPEIKPSETK